MWDPRPVQWPKLTPRMFRTIRAWVDENARTWDTYVQAHAILLTNPIVRSIANVVIRLFAPPQPTRIVASEAEALDFHATCCRKPRSWVKPSYADRDQRFALANNLFGATGSGASQQPAKANAKPAKGNDKPAKGSIAKPAKGKPPRQSKSAKSTDVAPACSLVPPSGRAWACALATQVRARVRLRLGFGFGLGLGLGLTLTLTLTSSASWPAGWRRSPPCSSTPAAARAK